MTFDAFATTLRVICIANGIDLRISEGDYCLVSADKEIHVSKGNDSYTHDILIVVKNIDIVSCPFKYVYDKNNRSIARIHVPLSDFRSTSDAERAARWMIETLSNNKVKLNNLFVKLFKWIKERL